VQSPGQKWILCIFEVRKKLSGTPFLVSTGSITAFKKSNSSTFKDLQTQIQGLSRTISVFKNFAGLENLEKNSRTFKDPQESCYTN